MNSSFIYPKFIHHISNIYTAFNIILFSIKKKTKKDKSAKRNNDSTDPASAVIHHGRPVYEDDAKHIPHGNSAQERSSGQERSSAQERALSPLSQEPSTWSDKSEKNNNIPITENNEKNTNIETTSMDKINAEKHNMEKLNAERILGKIEKIENMEKMEKLNVEKMEKIDVENLTQTPTVTLSSPVRDLVAEYEKKRDSVDYEKKNYSLEFEKKRDSIDSPRSGVSGLPVRKKIIKSINKTEGENDNTPDWTEISSETVVDDVSNNERTPERITPRKKTVGEYGKKIPEDYIPAKSLFEIKSDTAVHEPMPVYIPPVYIAPVSPRSPRSAEKMIREKKEVEKSSESGEINHVNVFPVRVSTVLEQNVSTVDEYGEKEGTLDLLLESTWTEKGDPNNVLKNKVWTKMKFSKCLQKKELRKK